METAEREALEARVRSHCESAAWPEAATAAVDGYGPEILSYLMAVLRDEAEASEIFGAFCEALWKGLPGFRWECSFRTWAYTLARHALSRRSRDHHRRLGRPVPLSQSPELWQIAERVRTATLTWLKTEAKDRFAELRAELTPEQQTLLILRVNRRMTWTEVARVLSDEPDPDEEALRRTTTALRKQFQRIKEQLRRLAEERGLRAKE